MGKARSGSVVPQPFRWYVIFGAGLWWAIAMSVLYRPTSLSFVDEASRVFPSRFGGIATALAFAVFFRVLASPRGRALLARTVMAMSFLLGAAYGAVAIFGPVFSSPFDLVLSACGVLAQGIMLQLWGARFAFLEPDDVAHTMTFTAGVALAAFLLLGLVPAGISPCAMACLLGCSAILFSIDGNASSPGPRRTELTPALLRFYLSRLAMGLAVGLTLAVYFEYGRGVMMSSGPAVVLAVGVIVCAVAFVAATRRNILASMPLVPLLAVGALALPVARAPVPDLVLIAPAAIWLLWAMLSSLQVSRLARGFGVNEVMLTSTEKAVVITSIMAGTWAGGVVLEAIGATPTMSSDLSEGLLYVVLVASSFSLLRFTLGYYERARDRVVKIEASGGFPMACENVARRFGLTVREGEVLTLLCQGMTQSQICESLGVAGGTVRTHIHHIHKKLDIHRNEELLDLVREEIDAMVL